VLAINQIGLLPVRGYTCRRLRPITHNSFKECHQRAVTPLQAKEISDRVQPVHKLYQVELKSLQNSNNHVY